MAAAGAGQVQVGGRVAPAQFAGRGGIEMRSVALVLEPVGGHEAAVGNPGRYVAMCRVDRTPSWRPLPKLPQLPHDERQSGITGRLAEAFDQVVQAL